MHSQIPLGRSRCCSGVLWHLRQSQQPFLQIHGLYNHHACAYKERVTWTNTLKTMINSLYMQLEVSYNDNYAGPPSRLKSDSSNERQDEQSHNPHTSPWKNTAEILYNPLKFGKHAFHEFRTRQQTLVLWPVRGACEELYTTWDRRTHAPFLLHILCDKLILLDVLLPGLVSVRLDLQHLAHRVWHAKDASLADPVCT